MNAAARIVVTAAEFTRQFGQLRSSLGEHPVFVTHHGRETHVLLSAQRYDAIRAQERPCDAAAPAGLVEWIRDGLIVLDDNGLVVLANDPAHALLDLPTRSMVGRALWEAAPVIATMPLLGIIHRALMARERASAELPCPVRPGAWLQFELYPARGTVTILLRDVTEQIGRDRLADVPGTTEQAIALHPEIARIELNPRGHIAAASGAACEMIGLSAERLSGVAAADLMPTAHKPAFRALLDQVLSGGPAACLATAFLTNAGETVAIIVTLAALNGCYGVEGAIMLATRREGSSGTPG